MNTSRLNHQVRHNWEIVFLLLLIMVVFCLAGGLFVRRISDVSGYEFLPVVLDSVLDTNYELDPNPIRRPPLRLDIIWDTIRDNDPDATDLAERQEALLNKLQTPVPQVTPQLCQGRHVIYATRDTWLDSTRPTGIMGTETTLRLGFSDAGRKRPLLYFPVSDRIPPGSFIGRASLELDLPPDTPAAVPGGVCFFNLSSSFDETGTNWSNQPEAYLPYCSQAIPGTHRFHAWDVTGLVNDWLQGRYPNSGLMIDLVFSTAVEPVYLSREAAGMANFQTGDQARPVGPRLVIDCGGVPPTPAGDEIAQVPPVVTPGLPAATGVPQTPIIAATGTALAGSPPPVSATPRSTPVFPPTGTRAATVTAPAATPTRPVSTGSPTPAATATRPVSTGSPTPATTPTRPVSTGSPTPATVAPTPVAPSPTVPPATSTSPPPEPTSKPATSAPTATAIVSPPPTSTASPTATATASPTPTATATASPTATSIPQADLAISKNASADPVVAGDNLTYILNISNNGPAVATGVAVTDSLPPAVSLVSATSSQGGCTGTGTLACALGDINPGGAASITVVVNVPAGATGSLANSATVSAGPADPNPANNTGTAVTTISQAADLVISKSDSPDPVLPGQTLTYTLAITNNGPSTATGVVITDTLPASVAFASASGGCTHTAGVVTCAVGSLASGGSRTYQVAVTVDPAASGTLINTATVTGSEADPTTGNNTATIGTTVSTQAADLAISKSDSPDPVLPGQTLTYTLAITNNGPSTATGVTVSDTLPAAVTFASASAGCTHTAGVVTCAVGSLASGGSRTYQVAITVDPAASGTLINTATVTGSETDPTTANNTATIGTTVTAEADLVISKSDSPDPVVAGNTLTYTLAITNNGPSTATGVTVSDTLPTSVAFASASTGCTHTAGVVTCAVGSLASGGSRTYQVAVTVDPAASGTLINTATVAGNETDPDTGNNTASVGTTVTAEADLVISKSDSPDPVVAGNTLTYTLAITNNGPSTATGVVITDTLPAAVTFASAPAGCAHTAGVVTCAVGSLASGGSTQYLVVVALPAGISGTLTNQAGITGSETDPNPANNTTAVTTTITPAADLSITKNANPGSVNAGQPIDYMINITNNGPANATGVVITDTLPSGVTLIAAPGCTINGNILTCPVGNVDSGKSAGQNIVVRVNPETLPGSLTNLAQVDGNEFDPVPGNNTATVGTIITTSTDLSAGISAEPEVAIPGGDLTYTIVISNNGPSAATGAIITDTLPASVAFASAPAGCTHTAGVVTCNGDSLASGGSRTYQVAVTVDPAASGTLINTATVTGSETDPNTVNNTVTVSTTISVQADLAISKSDSPDPVVAGNTLTYTLAITNNGPSTATGVVITDTLPASVVFASAPAGCTHTAGVVTCAVGSLASGGSRTYQVAVTVDPAASGTLINSATVAGNETDPVSNNTSTVGTTVTTEADLAVSKSVNNAAPLEQEQILYTVTVVNDGPSHATGVVINDALPVDLTHVSDNSGGSYNSGSGIWTVGNLASSASVTLLITATVNPETAGKTITNTALISASDQADPVPGNDTASAIIKPALPVLSIDDVTISEGDSGTTTAIFTVTLSAASTQTATVSYGTADNTATLAGNDYNAAGGTLTFSPGVTTQTVAIQVNGDTNLESDETFFVNLSNPAGAGIADGQGEGTILDDDGLSTITLTDVWDAWMEENNPGNTHGNEDNMQVQPPGQEYRTLINFHTLTTSLPAGSTVLTATLHLYQDGVRAGQAISIYPLTTNWVESEVKWSKASNGTGGDWVNPAGGGDFDTGTTWATFDPATDGHRYINITGLVQAWAAGTYANYGMILTSTSSGLDDGAVKFYTHEHATSAWRPSLEIVYTTGGSISLPSLSIGNVTVSEGDSGTTPAVFNVTLSGISTQTVTVDYVTADNTATTADNDYVATSGTLTFAPGVTQQPITVTVVGDTKPENSQSFFVNLSNPQNAVIANGQGLGTIVQDVGGLSLPESAGSIRLYLPVIVKPGN